jgi:hypothetical protein
MGSAISGPKYRGNGSRENMTARTTKDFNCPCYQKRLFALYKDDGSRTVDIPLRLRSASAPQAAKYPVAATAVAASLDVQRHTEYGVLNPPSRIFCNPLELNDLWVTPGRNLTF